MARDYQLLLHKHWHVCEIQITVWWNLIVIYWIIPLGRDFGLTGLTQTSLVASVINSLFHSTSGSTGRLQRLTIKYYYIKTDNSLVKINCYLLNNNDLVDSDGRFYSDSGYYWVESCSVVCPGWPKKYFLQLVGTMSGV